MKKKRNRAFAIVGIVLFTIPSTLMTSALLDISVDLSDTPSIFPVISTACLIAGILLFGYALITDDIEG